MEGMETWDSKYIHQFLFSIVHSCSPLRSIPPLPSFLGWKIQGPSRVPRYSKPLHCKDSPLNQTWVRFFSTLFQLGLILGFDFNSQILLNLLRENSPLSVSDCSLYLIIFFCLHMPKWISDNPGPPSFSKNPINWFTRNPPCLLIFPLSNSASTDLHHAPWL